LFNLWVSDGHGTGTPNPTNGTTGALQAFSTEIGHQRAVTSADGTASGSHAMAQYINRVTGTDVVSAAEYAAGFTITGKAAAGASGTIRFWLDNNRVDGDEQMGTQLVSGVTPGVTINYNNATGDYTISFAANSAALQQATHNTYSSGVHKLTVDTDGSSGQNGTGLTAEASRLFLVASGTAQVGDDGSVGKNYSVQDRATGNVFVYYHGDPDANGIGVWTPLDSGDAATIQGNNITDRDTDSNGWGDWDYYNTTGVTVGTQSTPANTAMGFVTNIAAQVWEFQMAKPSATMDWSTANTFAGNHTTTGSNTSRMASLEEMLALYAANFGVNTVGAVQAMTDTTSFIGVLGEDNRPGGWATHIWSSAPTPSGHATIDLYNARLLDRMDGIGNAVSAVL
jgi:hypothetical protein